MSKKRKNKIKPETAGHESETPLEMQAEAASEVSETSETAGNAPENTAEPESKPKKGAKKGAETANACPRCKHVNGNKAIRLGKPNRSRCHIVIDGTAYSTVEAQMIMCEKCKQRHFIKTYK